MTSISYGATHEGRVRDHNEDTFADVVVATARGDYHLLVVADGMGGHARGEVASAMATAAVREYVEYGAWRDPGGALRAAFRLANERVHADAGDMGTTLVAALIEERTGRYWIENVGDSRGYLVTRSGITPLTNDHSAIAAQVEAGQLTREEASQATGRNVLLRAIGADAELESDSFGPHVLAAGERLLLCSDGLHAMVTEQRIAEIAIAGELCDLPAALIEAANAGGGHDNITALVAAMPAANATVVDASMRPPLRAAGRRLPQLVAGLAAFAVVATVSSTVVVLALGGGRNGNPPAASGTESATAAPRTATTAITVGSIAGPNDASPTAAPTTPATIATTATTNPVAVAGGAPIAPTSTPAPAPTAGTQSPTTAPTPVASPSAQPADASPTGSPTPGLTPSPTATPSPSGTATVGTTGAPSVEWVGEPKVDSSGGMFNVTVRWTLKGGAQPPVDVLVDGKPADCSQSKFNVCSFSLDRGGFHTIELRATSEGVSNPGTKLIDLTPPTGPNT